MFDKEEHLERTIIRKLDDELSADEAHELNLELIRNPEAQRLLEGYERLDATVSACLADAIGETQELGFDPFELTRTPQTAASTEPRRSYNRAWWLVPGAIAAAMVALLMVQPKSPSIPADGPLMVQMPSTRIEAPIEASAIPSSAPSNGTRQAGHRERPRQIQRRTARDVLGVMGDDGNIYLFEVDRTRTTKRARRTSDVRQAIADY